MRLDVGTTKTGAGRTFYFGAIPELKEMFTDQLASINKLKEGGTITPFVFHHADGSRIKDFYSAWRSACDSAGYKGQLLHDFRRTAARNLERAGVPRTAAMAMVGHKTESIYRRYSIQDEQSLREGAAKYAAWAVAKPDEPAAAKAKVKQFRKRA